MISNSRGQALFETLFALPSLIGLVTLCLVGLFNFLSHFLTDHWVYQASLCLAQEKDPKLCRQQLTGRLKQIPFEDNSLVLFKSSKSQTHVMVEKTSTLKNVKEYKSHLTLPIRFLDFKDSL